MCTLVRLAKTLRVWNVSLTPLTSLARIIHEGFYYNRRYAVPTGVLATQSVNILFKYASLLPGCACPSHDASQRFRHESS
jgi:hypothetical protein